MIRTFYLVIAIVMIGCADEAATQFELLSSDYTGVDFNNLIDDSDSLHILNFEYIYNGGGVAIGDFNNDSLPDVFFTGNMVDNALYLNRGGLIFDDISDSSGISKHKRWSSGVTVVDINSDGLLDVYVCSTGHDHTRDKSNLLFINKGVDNNGIPKFVEMAKEYGIDENTNSTHAVFFDYDNDDDLDLFIIANEMPDDRSPSRYRQKVIDGTSNTTDHLYENKYDEKLGHQYFTEVSEEAGILLEGYSLGVNICDINQDGWKDIFVSNDYLSNDIFYINNRDGTFTNKAGQLFKHTSFSAMGTDVIDINNDGESDLITVDMLPEDNYRRKTMLSPNRYTDYANNKRYGFDFQFVRNTFQINNSKGGDIDSNFIFSDVAFMAGVSATDWSWAPLIADFDNDGDRDMIITNGFPKDITDRDFINYSTSVKRYADDQTILKKVPSVKLLNYAYRNDGDNKFEKVSKAWGITEPSFSNGAAYVDLDNDGDLDYVVNNINSPAFIYENVNTESTNWLRIKLRGPDPNLNGIGATIRIYSDTSYQVLEHNPVRGYLSSHELVSHFGLGQTASIDSIVVEWSPTMRSLLTDVKTNQVLTVRHDQAVKVSDLKTDVAIELFREVSDSLGLSFVHQERDVIDFNSQALLLHKLSQYGPALSIGDADGDGLDDLFISGSAENESSLFLQTAAGKFLRSDIIEYTKPSAKAGEELGAIFFDADMDGDDDLYIVHGGNEYVPTSEKYHDKLYVNDGTGFKLADNGLPKIISSGLAVKAADYDSDGDLDLFVGGRVVPGQYPTPGQSYLLENKSTKDKLEFEEVTENIARELADIGMVTDALWTDHDSDGDLDLLVVGELMKITIFDNTVDGFQKKTINDKVGFWNSIAAGDVDNDGDTDYVIGNLGTNIVAGVNEDHPIRIYYKDFDDNGVNDMIPTCYFEDKDGVLQEYPYHNSLDIAKQYNAIKKKFVFHGKFAVATMKEIFSSEELDSCLIYESDHLYSSILINDGQGNFTLSELPNIVQRSPIYGMRFLDIDKDENLDILMVGNDHGMEVGIGRLDAHDGIVGMGRGDGTFDFETGHTNGFLVQGDAKALVSLYHQATGSELLIASQNQGKLKAFVSQNDSKAIKVNSDETHGIVKFKNGSKRRVEFYYGSSFLSQSSRMFFASPKMESIQLFNGSTTTRRLEF